MDTAFPEFSDSDLKKLLSQKLVMLRKASGQTMEAEADSLDLYKSEYFRFLSGARLPHLRTLLHISKKYGVTLDWWFRELETLPQDRETIRQKTFELRSLSIIRKFPARARGAVLAMLESLAKNFLPLCPR